MYYVPGWIGILNNDIEVFKTGCRVINDYGKRYFSTKIRNGDFSSEYPFSVVKEANQYSLITIESPSSPILFGSSSFIPITDQIEIFSFDDLLKEFPNTIIDIILSSLILLLQKYGYKRPIETRGFLGKRSKGIISDRNHPISNIRLKWKNSIRNFSLCKAEILRISLFETDLKFFLTYHPRYEIFEEDFLLPQYSEIKDVLVEKWQDTLLMNSEKVLERLNELNEIIRYLDTFNSLVKSISTNQSYNLYNKKLKLPILKTISNQTIILNSVNEFSDTMRETFENSLNLISKPIIRIIIDRGLDHDKSSLKTRIKSVIDSFGVEAFFSEFNYKNDLKEEFFITNGSNAILYVIDTEIEGANGRYRCFKDITLNLGIPNKVVRFSTVSNSSDEDFLKAITLCLLGLIYRYNQVPFWKLDDEIYDIVFAYSETVRMNGYVKILSLSMFFSGKRRNIGELVLNRSEESVVSAIEILEKEILDIVSDSLDNKTILLMTEYTNNSDTLEFIIDWFSTINAKILKVEIFSKDEGRVLRVENEEKVFTCPLPGSFVQVGRGQKFGEYLLVTREIEKSFQNEKKDFLKKGKHDSSPLGLPRPLRVRIHSEDFNDHINALKYIFWSTFIHPTSFFRPRMPIDLLLAKRGEELIFKTRLRDLSHSGSAL